MTCNNCNTGTWSGDILKYCPTLVTNKWLAFKSYNAVDVDMRIDYRAKSTLWVDVPMTHGKLSWIPAS